MDISRERVIPVGGGNPYDNHPGFDAQSCSEQTGGHCLPGTVSGFCKPEPPK